MKTITQSHGTNGSPNVPASQPASPVNEGRENYAHVRGKVTAAALLWLIPPRTGLISAAIEQPPSSLFSLLLCASRMGQSPPELRRDFPEPFALTVARFGQRFFSLFGTFFCFIAVRAD